MTNRSATKPQEISWREWLSLLSPGGQQKVIDFIWEAQEIRGKNWLPEIKAEFPLFSWIAEIVCTCTADEAVSEIADEYPHLPIELIAADKIKAFHARLKFEIERKSP